MPAQVVVRDLRKSYGGHQAVRGVSFEVGQGEILGLLGPTDVGQLIERFALGEKADSPFDSLSGGQKQRLALALAFVNDPKVLFLDEPTTGLDPQSRRDLHESIQAMRADGRAVLLTTHYI